MKKFFSLVLALVMALSLTTVAWGATTHEVSTEDQLAELLDEDGTNDVAEGDTIKLLNSIQVQNAMHTSGTSTNGVSYTGGKSFTIDFNNCSVSAGSSINNAIFRIKTSGTVTLMNGTITASDVYYGVLANGTGTINLDNMTISLTNTGGQGVAVNAYAGTVNVNDGTEITATGAYAGMEVSGTANIYEGSTVSYVGDVPTANPYGSIGSAVGTSSGTLNIYGGELVSTATGGNTVATNSSGGTINITGGTITGETAVRALTDSHYNNSAEINISGGTINGALAETNYGGTADTEVTVSGGIFNTDPFDYLATGYETAAVGSTSDTFVVGQDIEVDNGKITAGTFTDDVSAYVAPGNVIVNGEVKKSTPTGNTTTYDVKDLTITNPAGVKQDTTGITSVIKVASVTNTSTVNGVTKTTFVPTYYQVAAGSSAGTFVECDKSVADYLFTIKGVGSVYVREMNVPAAFDATPVALYTAPKTATCDKVGANEDVYVVVDGKYYPTKNVVTESYGLLNGKMVVFDKTQAGTPTPHDWNNVTAASYNSATGKLTAVKCPVCKGTVAVYEKPGSFDGKEYKLVGGTGIASAYYYVVGASAVVPNGTVVTPSTDKVTSAETFDAGIALYVGMSVMAAAGSAVVLKKKD